jgi:protein-L-isoaspartate(D-aspartate) O-methyltransferase
VVATGAVAEIPSRWLAWLKPGGRILVIAGQSPVQRANLLTREAVDHFREEGLFETDLPYLIHAEPVLRFVL